MKKYLFIITLFFATQLNAQSKKEQISILGAKVDSLYLLLTEERSLREKDQREYQSQIQGLQKEIKSLKKQIVLLDGELERGKIKADSIQKSHLAEMNRLYDNLKQTTKGETNKFLLGYKYGRIKDPNEDRELTTIFIPSENKNYVIADSIISDINSNEKWCFYFVTLAENVTELSCPFEYGLIIMDINGTEIYKSFWDFDSNAALKGNCYPQVLNFKSANTYRNLMSLSASACGSGASTLYYDIIYNNKKVQFKEAFGCGGGYSDYHFIPEDNVYIRVLRISPECHYSCPSKYQINSFSLYDDTPLKTVYTKFQYDDYNDTGIDALLKKIKSKEKVSFY